MKKAETRKENLLRRLEENREFFLATRKCAYASFMEELTEYIEECELPYYTVIFDSSDEGAIKVENS